MAEGIGEAVEIMRVTIDGTAHFIKFAYESIKELAALVIAIKKSKEANVIGNVPFDKLLKNADGNVRLVKVPDDRLEEFGEALKKYNVQFSQMFDLNPADGYGEFAFSYGQLSLVKSVTEQLKIGDIISMADYTQNADQNYIKKIAQENQSPSLSISDEKNQKLNELVKKIENTAKENKLIESSNNKRIVIDDYEPIYNKNDKIMVPTKIKSLEGEKMYILLDKSEIVDKEGEVSIFLNDNKKYNLVNSSNNVIDTLSGRRIREELLKKNKVKSAAKKSKIVKSVPLAR